MRISKMDGGKGYSDNSKVGGRFWTPLGMVGVWNDLHIGLDSSVIPMWVQVVVSVILQWSSGPEVAESVIDGIEFDSPLVTASQLFS